MFFQGDHIKIKNKDHYEGKFGKIVGYDGVKYYTIELSSIKKKILCLEDQIEKISEDIIKKKEKKITLYNGTTLNIKDQDLRLTCDCLKSNKYFKGLYALGKYYSSEYYPEKHGTDFFTQEILKIKNFDKYAAKNISDIILFYINKSDILKKIINMIDFIVMMPSAKYKNHVELWAENLCKKLNKRNLSEFIFLNKNKLRLLKYYKYKKQWERSKIMEDAFIIYSNFPKVEGKKCLILDDICTTGNQINALTNLLVNEGVLEVYALVIGRTKF